MTDHTSREGVLAVLSALVAPKPAADDAAPTPSPVLGALIKWVDAESTKLTKAGTSSSRFVVLTWAATLLPFAQHADQAQFDTLALSLSSLFDGVEDEKVAGKRAVRKSAEVVARRAVRNVSSHFTLTAGLVAAPLEPRANLLVFLTVLRFHFQACHPPDLC